MNNTRFVGTLHKLCDNGPHKKGGWTDLMTYIELHSISDHQAWIPPFESPLAPYSAPSPQLERDLLTREGPRKEETPLRIVGRTAPSHIIAALCHLCPKAAQIQDSRGRLALHVACRRPTKERDDEKAIRILMDCYPNSLLHRDQDGRTPLHYLLWYHAATRSTRLVEAFFLPMPSTEFVMMRQPNVELPPIPMPNVTSIPPTCAIIPDSRYGCLPLHYAVMEGASRDVVKLLLQAYPGSKTVADKFGRVALSWYLGAGLVSVTGSKSTKSSSAASKYGLQVYQQQHVSGESPDPNAPPLYMQKRSTTIIALLLNSKSARSIDSEGRCPLHWAAYLLGQFHYFHGPIPSDNCVHLKVVQSLLDHYMDATVLQDNRGMTPLHLLFDAALYQQDIAWQQIIRNHTVRDSVNLQEGGGGFSPLPDILEMLLKQSTTPEEDRPKMTAAHFEDPQGHLPIHLALMVATTKDCLSLLIQAHPTSLLHTTEEVQTPIHCALSNPFSTPLQSRDSIDILLQAYVTSRHGTFVNGKIALKMEDANGQFPLHCACLNQACYQVLQLLVDAFPKIAITPNANGDLPIHCLLDARNLFEATNTSGMVGWGATLASSMGWISDSETAFQKQQLSVQRECMKLFVQPMLVPGPQQSEALRIGSSAHGMLPLHIVVAFDAVDYRTLYQMLDLYPESAELATTAVGHRYTALDFHEMRQHDSSGSGDSSGNQTDRENWLNIRELLFAFGTNHPHHRQKEDLLEQCVNVIRDEAMGKGSTHMTEFVEWMKSALTSPALQMKQTLSTVEAPEIDRGFKPKKARSQGKPNTPSHGSKPIPVIPQIKPTLQKSGKDKQKKERKSMYDNDEFDHRYYVDKSDGEDEDDDYLSVDSTRRDELYDNRDDPRYRNDEFDEEDTVYSDTGDDTRTFDDTIDTRTLDSRSTRRSKRSLEQTVNDQKRLESLQDESRFEGQKKEEEAEDEAIEAPFLSDVAMRLWTFFVLYYNAQDPRDNYAEKVKMVFHKMPFPTIQELTTLRLPPYAQKYFPSNCDDNITFLQKSLDIDEGKTLGDLAHNACKAVMHQATLFAGRYEFPASAQDSLVMQRSDDGMTILVRATENIITVEQIVHREEEPGKAESEIWNTGSAPPPVKDSLNSVFDVKTRTVCMKFMRSQQAYLREVQCRRDLGIPVDGSSDDTNFVVPLLNHFNAFNESDREDDQRYRFDLQDERFRSLDLGGGVILDPSLFPYAVVLPFRADEDLFTYFLNQGRLEKRAIREIGFKVGKALQAIHLKGLIHGRVSLSNIRLVTPTKENSDSEPYWALTDLTGACKQATSLMAGIPSTGAANFATSLFPPELFVKLSTAEIKIYKAYWEAVQSSYNVIVDPLVINPHVHPVTGETYALRCHFEPDETNDEVTLPQLPYKLVAAREPVDIWSYGKVMFTLCSAGHPLFANNIKSGQLLAYDQVATFSHPQARESIYKFVEDPLAQDLLFHLLGTYEQRASLTIENILNHPFFCPEEDMGGSANSTATWHEKAIAQVVSHRKQESAAYLRTLQDRNIKQSEGEWVTLRSTNLHCWDLKFAMRMHLSPSSLLRHNILGAPDIPLGIVVLPYKLARSKSGKLTPSTKRDVERAEKMGIHLLALVRSCQFVSRMENVVEDPQYFDKVWTITDLLRIMDLTVEDNMDDYKIQLTQLAGTHVELFREDPLALARRIVQQRIVELQQCVADEKAKAYLYLVDDFVGVPILSAPYPCEIKEKKMKVLQHTLPLMYMNVIYTCAVAEGISGLVKLIFEAAYPHIPPSWTLASNGLTFSLNQKFMEQQLGILRLSIADLFNNKGKVQPLADLQFLQQYLELRDSKNTYANLRKVTINGDAAALWTTAVHEIEALLQESDIHHAFESQSKLVETISEKARRIEELEKALESSEFKRRLNLTDVDVTASEDHTKAETILGDVEKPVIESNDTINE